MTPTDEIDAYLAGLPEDQRRALQDLREAISRVASEAEETISYGAPAFRYRNRPLVCYSAAKAHVSFFPMSPAVIEAHQDLLAEWSTSKGTIRFTPDRPLPTAVIDTLVRARLAELDAAASR